MEHTKDYNFFRITSGLARKSEYEWEDLKDLDRNQNLFTSVGTKAKPHGLRITSHPSQLNVLTSPHEHVVENCIGDLTRGDVFDMLGQSRHTTTKSTYISVIYGDKPKSMERFVKILRDYQRVKSRLTVENDDKQSMYSVKVICGCTVILACVCSTTITTVFVMVVNKRLWVAIST